MPGVRANVSPWNQCENKGFVQAPSRCVEIWVGEFNQSVTRKEAYAQAFAEVLREAGVTAYASSRKD